MTAEEHTTLRGPGEPEGGWRANQNFDTNLRRAKARKLIRLIERRRSLAGARILEIGTGAGIITAELARAATPSGKVVSIDTIDTRTDHDGYEFRTTSGVELPFEAASFDVVVSNHVIEHVGGRPEQQVHLNEISRVLDQDGLGYLATPSRWALVEPHFKVPMLSWPPRKVRDRYLRTTGKGKAYDVDPLGPREIRAAFGKAGLAWTDVALEAIDELVRAERPTRVAKVLARTPEWALRAARPAMPTMVFVVQPKSR